MITNTSKNNPLINLLTGLPGGIEAQERRGQTELVNSDMLPTDCGKRADYEALGFSFGEKVEGDPVFQKATLPAGWKRQGSDHDMWSYIVDERGLKRVAIFYKAAFYDRSARMSLCDVGQALAFEFIWGDAKEPSIPTTLTPEEKERAREGCKGAAADRKARADLFLKALG